MDEQNLFLEMMKQHISSGLNFSYPTSQLQSDGETSSNIDEHENLPTPIVYKKRARIKFSQEQLDILEATFQQHRYPTIDMVDDLVEQLNLPTQKITVWFQNRRARLKKSQQKPDENVMAFERDDLLQPRHYDSGIQLDDEGSRDSTTSSPTAQIYPSMNYFSPPPPPLSSSSSSSYYFPSHHQTFYNPMWQNFQYPMSSNSFTSNSSYPIMNYNGSFLFHEMPHHYPQSTECYNSI